jgi:hypothetical protein
MVILRYVLMALTTALLGHIAYWTATHKFPASERVLDYSVMIGLILNLVYLYFSHPAAARKQSRLGHRLKQSRLARLVSLWLDAKERELRDRAKQRSGG